MTDVTARPKYDVFLCHNSKDKEQVREIAEQLEIEAGLRFFLDEYGIPPSSEFRTLITEALGVSESIAIFLGKNGWGDHHLWEAQRAIERRERDQTFRVIPVFLPGMQQLDWHRLFPNGDAPPYSAIDLRECRFEEKIDTFQQSVRGLARSSSVAPAKLTPYLIRRQAKRYINAGRKDSSLLFTGRQLAEAQNLLLASRVAIPPHVSEFLQACHARQLWLGRRRAYIAIGVACLTTALVLVGLVAMESRRTTHAERLAGEVLSSVPGRPGQAARRALDAYHHKATPRTTAALMRMITERPRLDRFVTEPYNEVQGVRVRPTFSDALVIDIAGLLHRYDLENGMLLEKPVDTGISNTSSVGGFRLLSDAERMVVWDNDGKLFRFDRAMSEHAEIGRLDARIQDLGVWSDSEFLILDASGEVVIWSSEDQCPIGSFSSTKSTPRWIETNVSRNLVAVGSKEAVHVFQRDRMAFNRHEPGWIPKGPGPILFGSSGNTVLVVEPDARRVRLHRLGSSSTAPIELTHESESAVCLAISHDESLFAAGFSNGDVIWSETSNPANRTLLKGFSRPVTHLHFLQGRRGLIVAYRGTGREDPVVRWNLELPTSLVDRMNVGAPVRAFDVDAMGARLAVLHRPQQADDRLSCEVSLWDLRTRARIETTRLALHGADEIAIASNGEAMALANAATVEIYVVGSGETQPVTGFDGSTTSLAFDQSGRHLAIGTTIGRILLYSVPDRQTIAEIALPKRVLSWSGDLIQIEALDTLARVDGADRNLDFTTSNDRAESIAFDADGRYLVVGTSDGEVLMWDLEFRYWRGTGPDFNPPRKAVHRFESPRPTFVTVAGRNRFLAASGDSWTAVSTRARATASTPVPGLRHPAGLTSLGEDEYFAILSDPPQATSDAIGSSELRFVFPELRETVGAALSYPGVRMRSLAGAYHSNVVVTNGPPGEVLIWRFDPASWLETAERISEGYHGNY